LVEPGLSVLADLIGAAAITLLPGQPAVDLLPAALRRRMSLRRRQPCLIAAALLMTLTPVPPILHYRQVAATVRAKVVALEKNLAPVRAREVRLQATLGQLQQLQDQISRLETVQARRAAWQQFFAAVQERLVQVEDVWLEQVQLIPPMESKPLKLALSGRMLERKNPTAPDRSETNSRVKELLAGLAGLPQVAAVESERIDHSQPGLLRFDFILVSNPAHPL
jgi:type IV pilus assembly protein PilM